jgi:hypothetical protein
LGIILASSPLYLYGQIIFFTQKRFMKKNIKADKLQELLDNHRDNKDLPIHTNWGVIMIKDLLDLLDVPNADDPKARETKGVAIALIRFPLKADGPLVSGTKKPRVKAAGLGLSQVSFALIPGRTGVAEPWTFRAKKNRDGTIPILCICEPGKELNKDGAGLCPPQGDEIDTGG